MKKKIRDKYYTRKKGEKLLIQRTFTPPDELPPVPEKRYKTTDPDELAFLKRLEKKKQEGVPTPNAKADFDKVLKEMIDLLPDSLKGV